MLVWLIQHFRPLLEQMQLLTTGDSRVFITARVALAGVTSFIAAIILGPLMIRWLKVRFQERIASASETLNDLHREKNATPTMGGVFICAAIVIASLICGDLTNPFTRCGIGVVTAFCALGVWDDWVKLSTTQNGLTVKQKFAVQLVLATGFATAIYCVNQGRPDGLQLVFPFGDFRWSLGVGFILWAVFVLVGSSNGVNLTDGLDGLATGCMIFAGSAFTALTYLAGHRTMAEYLSIPYIEGCGELSVVMGAMVGAMLGFLWFNCYPAQVFMGDAGSLPIGALLGLAALACRQEILLVLIGGVFVVETLSVIAQVGWFRMTGNRLIACSPLHNHFLFKGQHEIKIVVRFWISSALLALIAVASLKIR
ncbi:MAG: phospho-N-acetylmuramoyl-pentapeptide-transferase [Planctomycetaceae bacterium]